MKRKTAVLLATIGLLVTIISVLVVALRFSPTETTEDVPLDPPHMSIVPEHKGAMDLSTALFIPIFCYILFLGLLAIEYITDKQKKERAPPQKSASQNQKPQEIEKEPKAKSSEQLEDLEATEKKEPGKDTCLILK